VETVGTGQQEVEIINHAHTVVVVLVPGMGDEIQAIKAGIMEIGDIFAINKADREGAGKLQRELMTMIDMSPIPSEGWRPPILTMGNAFKPDEFEKDIEKLSTNIYAHYDYLISSNFIGDRLRRKTIHELNEALRSSILEPVLNVLVRTGELDRMVEKLLKKESDPCSLSEEIARKYLQGCL
jgi:LAO/AO transport system kinase